MRNMSKLLVLGLFLSIGAYGAETGLDGLLLLIVKKQGQEQVLSDAYGKALELMMVELTKKGDLDSYVVVEAEKKRFGKEKTVTSPSDSKEIFKVPVNICFKARITLLRQYIAALDSFMKAEMKAGRIDNAKEAKAEKDKAVKELADLESKMPKELRDEAKTNSVTVVKKSPVVGKWKWSDRGRDGWFQLEYYSDGRIEARGKQDKKVVKDEGGKWAFIDESKTKIRRISNNGYAWMQVYDVEKDIIQQQDGVILYRVNP